MFLKKSVFCIGQTISTLRAMQVHAYIGKHCSTRTGVSEIESGAAPLNGMWQQLPLPFWYTCSHAGESVVLGSTLPTPASRNEEVWSMLLLLLLVLLLIPSGHLRAQAKPLDIYWIDVEGGAATLIVSPSGESFLIDTGWVVDDRDAKRIYAATQLAGLKKIDYLLISHFHADHVGGLAALSKMIPIGKFYDHGDTIEKENQQWLDAYKAVSAGKRTIVKPGDEIPVKGLHILVVTSDQKILEKPVNGGGGPNPFCTNA